MSQNTIPFLKPEDPFPALTQADQTRNGLLAISNDLTSERIITAYTQGIFPWGTYHGYPIWHYPTPRMVLFPNQFKCSKSLRKKQKNKNFEIWVNRDFERTILECSKIPRSKQLGTWIDEHIISAYLELNKLSWAHSFETYIEGKLVGGLYGLAIGNIFFGESMFSKENDSSKLAFSYLVELLSKTGFELIDCQMYTSHLASLGAKEIGHEEFQSCLKTLQDEKQPIKHCWSGQLKTDI